MRAPLPLAIFLSFFSLLASPSNADTLPSSKTNVIPELKNTPTTTQVSTQVQGLPASSPPIVINVQLPNTEKPAAAAPFAVASAPPPAEPATAPAEDPKVIKITNMKADPIKLKPKDGEVVVQIPPTPTIKLIVDKRFVNSPDIKKLYNMLGASSSNRRIHFVDNRLLAEANPYDNIVFLQPRSFLDVLNYLSDAVDVPKELIDKGLVPAPRYPDGRIFDLKQMTQGLINIYRSKRKPTCNVNVAVYYRNHWFYIKDNDVSSKRTFLLAQQLFHLQSGEIGKTSPVLTIPVR